MADILLEVDEELRSQQLRAFWQRYGQLLITAAIAVVIGTGAGVFWHKHQNKRFQEETSRLIAIQGDGTKRPDLAKLEQLYKDSAQPLKSLIGLKIAENREAAGDIKGAKAAYQELADQARVNDIIQELAAYHVVRLGIAQGEKPDALLNQLDPLTKEGGKFRASALELKGLLLKQQGKIKEANAAFQQIMDDNAAPNTLHQRARALTDYGMADAQ